METGKAFRRVLSGRRKGVSVAGAQETCLKAFPCHVKSLFIQMNEITAIIMEGNFLLDAQYKVYFSKILP